MSDRIPKYKQQPPFSREVEEDALAMVNLDMVDGWIDEDVQISDRDLYFLHMGRLGAENVLVRWGLLERTQVPGLEIDE